MKIEHRNTKYMPQRMSSDSGNVPV